MRLWVCKYSKLQHWHVLAVVAGIKQRHGDLWIETKMVLHRNPHLKPYLEVKL